MNLVHLVAYMTLLFYLFFTHIAESSARPPTGLDTFLSVPPNVERPDSAEYLVEYPARSSAAKGSLLSRLRRGYYYIDENQFRPVNPLDISRNVRPAGRRQDSFVNQKNNKPKKLFVPNLFG